MSSILSIETANERNIKQTSKEWLGCACAIVAGKRRRQLTQNPSSAPHGLVDRMLMAHLKRKAVLEGNDDFFERLHHDFWKGDGGASFSTNCDHRFQDLFLGKQEQDFRALAETWKQLKSIDSIVEFGCNSGLLLNHMTTKLPGVKSSLGIEINAQQVKKNQQSSEFDLRVEFMCTDGGQWLLNQGRSNTLYVTNGGVLEYFRRERLNAMLRHIALDLRPAMFFAVEPVAYDHNWDKTNDSIPFGEELSFSHNYKHLFESNGFEIVHQRATEFESWKMVATIATVY